MSDAPLTLGTAGHIDHGKTALIRALTGVDTDRLPQERARGISIELGYARLELPSGRALSIIDVPGHERYVRTMVAGATGIDLYLMTIAADDGVMPQTREHAAVLRALAIERGVVAVTKCDTADPSEASAAASELLPGAEVVAVSARSGTGLEELRAALDRAVAHLTSRAERGGRARLHVDRVFSVRGAGTIATGTLWSGEVARGDALTILPGGRRARVREVQVHGGTVERARAGQRVAVNLAGTATDEVSRGDVVAAPGAELRETFLIDAALTFEGAEPDDRERVQIHHGTREATARLAWLGGPYWQVRLERALVPAPGDRFVIRRLAPPDTLGGGRVLDAHPRRHGPGREHTVRLARLFRGEPAEPEAAGPSPDGAATVHPPTPAPQPLSESALALEERLRASRLRPPPDSELDAADLAALRAAGRAVRVGPGLHFHPEALAEATSQVVASAGRAGGTITIATLRDELGTSRKFAQALLEHLDRERVTIRRGDAHVLRTRGRGPR